MSISWQKVSNSVPDYKDVKTHWRVFDGKKLNFIFFSFPYFRVLPTLTAQYQSWFGGNDPKKRFRIVRVSLLFTIRTITIKSIVWAPNVTFRVRRWSLNSSFLPCSHTFSIGTGILALQLRCKDFWSKHIKPIFGFLWESESAVLWR